MKVNNFKRYKKIPLEEKIIGFGKYKGELYVTLPEHYLRWLKNDFKYDAVRNIADKVLKMYY